MSQRKTRLLPILILMLALTLAACTSAPADDGNAEEVAATAAPAEEASSEAMPEGVNLDAVKEYAVGHAAEMKVGADELLAVSQRYYDLAAENGFDYAAMQEANAEEIDGLISAARAAWLNASEAYELDEGIVAGVPSLAYYDVLLDAGDSAADNPEEALDWTLTLPDGTELKSPGNYFHSLLEPTLWQTNPDFTVDAGDVALPDANLLLGTAQGLDGAAQELNDAIDAWEPTLSDAFTALIVMVPTMNEYFEQWKLSSFVSGAAAEEESFVAASRLFDVKSILNGLDVTYTNVSALVEEADPDLNAQIESGFDDLIGYVDDLYSQEQEGALFTPEEADLFGSEAQDKATALAGQVSQAAALLDIKVQE